VNRILSITAKHLSDAFPDPSYLQDAGFEDRYQQFQNGDFGFIGVQAEARIVVNGVRQTITSGGLWGIELNSDSAYISEVEEEETRELGLILRALGFSHRSIRQSLTQR
jgi:hypothetical protein